MENAHLVGRRLPAEAEPEARGHFTKKPKATFLRARCMTKWCGGPTVWPTPAPWGRCQVPGPACPRSKPSCCQRIFSHRPATRACCWNSRGNLPHFYQLPNPPHSRNWRSPLQRKDTVEGRGCAGRAQQGRGQDWAVWSGWGHEGLFVCCLVQQARTRLWLGI